MNDTARAIDALRASGAQRIDPVRLRHIEALARRCAAHQGAARRVLDARLAQLLAACRQKLLDAASDADGRPLPDAPRSALSGLLAQLAVQDEGADELKALRQHRSTWARLSLDLQLTQALAQVPDHAGPLNTQRLLHQALQVMREAAPQYLQQFMAHAEALLWLDQARLPGARRGGRSGARRPQT